jgi:hypothetical protein
MVGWLVQWCDDWRALRWIGAPHDHLLADHLLRDIGLTDADARRSSIVSTRRDRDAQDPKGPDMAIIFDPIALFQRDRRASTWRLVGRRDPCSWSGAVLATRHGATPRRWPVASGSVKVLAVPSAAG